MISANEFQRAIYSLDACNISGVIRDCARVLDSVWKEVRESGGGTDEVAHHPIIQLYISKCVELAGLGSAELDVFSKAYNVAKCRSKNGSK